MQSIISALYVSNVQCATFSFLVAFIQSNIKRSETGTPEAWERFVCVVVPQGC